MKQQIRLAIFDFFYKGKIINKTFIDQMNNSN